MAQVKVVRIKYETDNKALKDDKKLVEAIAKEFGVAEDQVEALNEELKKTGEGVKKGSKETDKFAASLKKAAGFFGLAFGVAAVKQFFSTAVKKTEEFQSALTSLSKITGAVGKDLDFLENTAKELALETGIAGSDILKAFELVGSAKPELLESGEALAAVTEQAIKLSQASGLELPTAINSLTNTLNQFGAGAEDAAKFVDSLAAGAKFGASAIPDTAEALRNFGTVAQSAGLDIDEAGALVQALAEKGIKGSEAGIKLRNVLLILQKDTKNYKDGTFDLNLALENQAEIQDNNIALLDKFDARNITAAQSLIKSRDKVIQFTEKLGTLGIATEQAEKEQQTLANAFGRLDAFMDEIFVTVGTQLAPAILGLINILTDTKSEGEKLNSAFQKQKELVNDIEGELIPLATRYEELNNKTNLTIEEQEELDKTFNELKETVPTAALELDAYGNIVGINTGKVAAFVNEQRNLLQTLNAEGIRDTRTEIENLFENIQDVSQLIDKGKGSYVAFGNSILNLGGNAEISDSKLDFLRKKQEDLRGEALQNIIALRDLGGVFSNLERETIKAAFGLDIYNQIFGITTEETEKNKDETEDARDKIQDLGKKSKKTKEEVEPLAGSIAFLRREVSKYREEQTQAVIGTEQFETATQSLEFAQRRLANALLNLKGEQVSNIDAIGDRLATVNDRAIRGNDAFTQDTEETLTETAGLWERYGQQIQSTLFSSLGSITTFQDASLNRQIAALEANQERQLKATEGNEQAQQAVREKFEKEAGELRKKNAKKKVLIESAIAAVKAFADLGPIGGAIALVALGINTAAQLSLIDSQSFFKGGFTGKDGLGFGDKYGEFAGYVHKDEFVMPKDKTRQWRPLLEMMHEGKIKPWQLKNPQEMRVTVNQFDDNRLYRQMVLMNRNTQKAPNRPKGYA